MSDFITSFPIYSWIDAAWLPLLVLAATRGQRLWAAGYVLASMMMMRLMAELMSAIGYPYGILPIWDMPIFTRGLWVYSAFYVLYGVLMHYSPGTKGVFMVAGSISLFFAAAFVFAGIMVL